MLRTVVSKSVINPCRIILNSTRNSQNQNLRFVRWRSHLPFNTAILFVPQQEAWVVERMGKYHRILDPGVNFLIPVIDSVKYVQSLKEITIDIPKQAAITSDNVNLNIDGVLYLRIIDPYRASYGVEDPEFAITQLAQTTMRSEIGKISLDYVFRERESLNVEIVRAINKASEAWGITCLRYEISLNAASLSTAVNYIDAFEKLASKNNTMILPANVADISGVVGSALSIYKNLSNAIDRNATLLTQSGNEETEEPTVEGVRRQVEASSKEISSDPQPILKPEDKF
ncbi:Stomatin-like protein 2, mitochondrial [Armadillidium nasatum]|uniref:Stomatin-like protein 2, mitochondrial n=1 Tax=Armadillidium nasatum TaxID=96803 RepID=A0A5N5TLD1_9CRUS|nr:Stomatin-like protein 2, mitochondrial [Armadillidium nasatum]